MADNLVLTGFMATGKSTIGAHCARLLGYTLRDTDQIVVERAGLSIPEIFASEGETGFRARERAVVEEIARADRQVIATGGGAILDPLSAAALKRCGRIVALTATPDTILARVTNRAARPLLASASDPGERVAELLAQRASIYARHADAHFRTDEQSPREVAQAIVAWYTRLEQAMLRVEVSLGDRSYPILIQDGLLSNGAAQQIASLAGGGRVCIVTHPGLRAAYAAPLEAGLEALGVAVSTVSIPAGERYKTLRAVERLYGLFLDARLDRRGVVIAVGGGVLGDVAGFAAATYLRGVRVVQVPTTLLAQVDSSVGGKTGVDLAAGKNLVGAFHQPSLVLIDPLTLRTLPNREVRSGLAEIIKYGIIYDAGFFACLAGERQSALRTRNGSFRDLIARSCQIKAEVVSSDEREQGLRAILNFGHTVGHALESVTHYRRYKHGEAIAIGMISAALVGEQLGVTPSAVTDSIRETLAGAGLPTAFPKDIETADILAAAQRDKKTDLGVLRFVIARSIGDVYLHSGVPAEAVERALAVQRGGESSDG